MHFSAAPPNLLPQTLAHNNLATTLSIWLRVSTLYCSEVFCAFKEICLLDAVCCVLSLLFTERPSDFPLLPFCTVSERLSAHP
jgi:hypothetical protein